MPEVEGKHFAYTEKGKRAAKEYASRKGSPAEYSPYKMKGHELPGPNQRSAFKQISNDFKQDNTRENVSEAGMNEFVANTAMGKRMRHLNTLISRRGKNRNDVAVGGDYEGGEDYNTISYEDSGIGNNNINTLDTTGDDGTNTLDTGDYGIGTEDNTTKKKVDVEVTVNDKKI